VDDARSVRSKAAEAAGFAARRPTARACRKA